MAALSAERGRRGFADGRGAGDRWVFAGAGSSRHAAEVAAVWFRRRGIEAEAHPATELADGVGGGGGAGRVLVGVTQCGATGSLLRLFEREGEAGTLRIAVTNEAGSPAAELADLAVVTRAGPERAIPATKTFTSALAVFRMLGAEAAGESGGQAPVDGTRAVGAIEAGLGRAEEAAAFAERSAEGPWVFAGEGALRPLAAEGALKMLETAAVPALSIPSGELAHGPRALLNERTPVVVLSERAEPGASEARSLAAAAEAGAPVLRIAPGPPPAAFRRDGFAQFDCGTAVELAPFFAAPVVQWLALYAGAALGRPVDSPEGLTKAVTDD